VFDEMSARKIISKIGEEPLRDGSYNVRGVLLGIFG
jgi:hypothetical protein